MKTGTGTFSILLLCVCLAGCSRDKADTVKVGVVAELTGGISAVGTSCKNAAELAVEKINKDGGIDVGGVKRKVELFVEDNADKAEQAVSAAQKLITLDQVSVLIGPNASRHAIPVSEVAESAAVPMIAPWSTNPQTTRSSRTGLPGKYVFRACFLDPFQGRVLAKFAKEKLQANTVAVLYDVASDHNKTVAEIFKATFESLGGRINGFETYTTGDKDFSAQLTRIKGLSPDALFLPNYYTEIPLQVQQAKRLGLDVPIFGTDAWGSSDLIGLCGEKCEGYYFSTHYASDRASPAAAAFISDYQAKYGNVPDDVAALTYDSFGLLWEAIRKQGSAEREKIREGLSSIELYRGITGDMQFQKGSGDPIKSMVIVQIKKGRFTWFADASM